MCDTFIHFFIHSSFNRRKTHSWIKYERLTLRLLCLTCSHISNVYWKAQGIAFTHQTLTPVYPKRTVIDCLNHNKCETMSQYKLFLSCQHAVVSWYQSEAEFFGSACVLSQVRHQFKKQQSRIYLHPSGIHAYNIMLALLL